MKATTQANIDLKEFLELVIMWHCAGDIPMNRKTTSEFIEDSYFAEFLQSVSYWSHKLGLEKPSRSDIVRTLHLLY